jgi:hypothetical protein
MIPNDRGDTTEPESITGSQAIAELATRLTPSLLDLFLNIPRRFSKFSNTFAEALSKLGYFLRAEEKHDDESNEKDFRHSKVTHNVSLTF